MDERLPAKHIVLLGVGHTNARVLRQWSMNPVPDAALTCISNFPVATYSGMLPAVLAGQLPPEAMQIDLVRLCASAGARLISDNVRRICSQQNIIEFDRRPRIEYDVLSVGIGSVPTVGQARIEDPTVVFIKPMQTFLQRLSTACAEAVERKRSRTQSVPSELNVVVAGSGAAGVEITFCLPGFLETHGWTGKLTLVTRSPDVLPHNCRSLQRAVRNELKRRHVDLQTDFDVVRVRDQRIEAADGRAIDCDVVIWATGAAPPSLLKQSDLPLADDGFIATDNTLRSVSGRPVFAVGDSGTIVTEKLPKAGVYAVRQGPVLWQNIQRILNDRPLQPYHPQRSFLKLLNTGDGRAIGEKWGITFSGRWVWRWKQHIDQKFMRMYQSLPKRSMANAADDMQCRGCGCKLGADVLSEALRSAQVLPDAVSEFPDDAAVIETPGGSILASTDFFTTPLNDPWLTGRIAALHAASDLIATGASVNAALANIVVPEGVARRQKAELQELLTGATEEFRAMNAEIVGGHTIVGSRWEVGFSVLGQPLTHRILTKSGLNTGDFLVLTKPLGIGVLLAAHMRAQCAAADFMQLLHVMLQRQHMAAAAAIEHGVTACTDVTGFGLAGHLLEMLRASRKSATINVGSLPVLPGAERALAAGIESTLAPANKRVEPDIVAENSIRQTPAWKILFDPQTCGGLLLGIDNSNWPRLQQRLKEADITAVHIGTVTTPDSDGRSRIHLT